jgi:hypothetical protein
MTDGERTYTRWPVKGLLLNSSASPQDTQEHYVGSRCHLYALFNPAHPNDMPSVCALVAVAANDRFNARAIFAAPTFFFCEALQFMHVGRGPRTQLRCLRHVSLAPAKNRSVPQLIDLSTCRFVATQRAPRP